MLGWWGAVLRAAIGVAEPVEGGDANVVGLPCLKFLEVHPVEQLPIPGGDILGGGHYPLALEVRVEGWSVADGGRGDIGQDGGRVVGGGEVSGVDGEEAGFVPGVLELDDPVDAALVPAEALLGLDLPRDADPARAESGKGGLNVRGGSVPCEGLAGGALPDEAKGAPECASLDLDAQELLLEAPATVHDVAHGDSGVGADEVAPYGGALEFERQVAGVRGHGKGRRVGKATLADKGHGVGVAVGQFGPRHADFAHGGDALKGPLDVPAAGAPRGDGRRGEVLKADAEGPPEVVPRRRDGDDLYPVGGIEQAVPGGGSRGVAKPPGGVPLHLVVSHTAAAVVGRGWELNSEAAGGRGQDKDISGGAGKGTGRGGPRTRLGARHGVAHGVVGEDPDVERSAPGQPRNYILAGRGLAAGGGPRSPAGQDLVVAAEN
mmetsp:Transcript_30028/g.87464  ORF Transcript_30028/g.87464 Transcript_30028/m.87464 type:complete len:434 (-) Transcript_30028:4315-5616(-)